VNPRPEIVSETEALALRLYLEVGRLDEDLMTENFYREGGDRDFWMKIARAAESAFEDWLKALPPSISYPEHQRLVREAKRASDDGEYALELERAIVKLVLMIEKDRPLTARLPHLGKVT
jgi:hypothetical protein